jgi:hypothetical protein
MTEFVYDEDAPIPFLEQKGATGTKQIKGTLNEEILEALKKPPIPVVITEDMK